MKKQREHTDRLIQFWILSLTVVTLAVLVSAWTASVTYRHRFQANVADALAEVIESQLESQASLEATDLWLPEMLARVPVRPQQLEWLRGDTLVFFWQQDGAISTATMEHRRRLSNGDVLVLVLPRAGVLGTFSPTEWALVGMGLFIALAMVWYGRRWLRQEMLGVEVLASRATRILAGEPTLGAEPFPGERPRAAGRALVRLHELWQQERQDKLELDRQVRASTFLDGDLGLGNAMFFERRLDGLAVNGEMVSPGMLCLVQFDGLEPVDSTLRLGVLKEYVHHSKALFAEHSDAVFARRDWLELALLIPMLPMKEVEGLATKLQQMGFRIALPEGADRDQLLHLGVAYFNPGDEPHQVLEEAEMALRAAQLQGHSNWFMYDKGVVDKELAQGSVRWRQLIEQALGRRALRIHYQPVYRSHGNVLCRELFSRLEDRQGKLLRASLYRPMARRSGLIPRIEAELLAQGLAQLRDRDDPYPCMVNVTAESLLHPRFQQALFKQLACYQSRRTQLILELNERELVQHMDALTPVLGRIKRARIQLSVDGVGYTVERTDYIDRFHVDWLKLHPSLVRRIHQRPEHQLIITSLIQAASHSPVVVLAEGIESQPEWDCLQALGVRGGQGALLGQSEA